MPKQVNEICDRLMEQRRKLSHAEIESILSIQERWSSSKNLYDLCLHTCIRIKNELRGITQTNALCSEKAKENSEEVSLSSLEAWLEKSIGMFIKKAVPTEEEGRVMGKVAYEIIKQSKLILQSNAERKHTRGQDGVSAFKASFDLLVFLLNEIDPETKKRIAEELPCIWRYLPQKSKEIKGFKAFMLHMLTNNIKILPVLLRLLDTEEAPELHYLIMQAIEKEISSLEELQELFALHEKEILSCSKKIESSDSLELFLLFWVCLYYSGTIDLGIIDEMVKRLEEKNYFFTIENISVCTVERDILLFLSVISQKTCILNRIKHQEVVWSIKSIWVLLYEKYNPKDISTALQEGSESSLLFFYFLSLSDASLTKNEFLQRKYDLKKRKIFFYLSITHGSFPRKVEKSDKFFLFFLIWKENWSCLFDFISSSSFTPAKFAVFLERSLPAAFLTFSTFPRLRALDLGRVLYLPKKKRILFFFPLPDHLIKSFFSFMGNTQMEYSLLLSLFIEALIASVSGERVEDRKEYSLPLLLKTPQITSILAFRCSKEREASIVELALTALEGNASLTLLERENLFSALSIISKESSDEALKKDLSLYLRKKRAPADPQYIHKESPLFILIEESISLIRAHQKINTGQENECVSLCLQKRKYFQEIESLSLFGKTVIKNIFRFFLLSYTALKNSSEALTHQKSISECVNAYYHPDLSKRNEPLSLPVNSVIPLTYALVHTIYPEKHFIYKVILLHVEHLKTLTLLEIYGIHAILEYLHAYNRKYFFSLALQYKKFSVGMHREKLSLRFKRHGWMHETKNQMRLMHYQRDFFSQNYLFSSIDHILAKYIEGIICITNSVSFLLFISSLSAPCSSVFSSIPCSSSKAFLSVFFYFHDPLLYTSYPGYTDLSNIYVEERKNNRLLKHSSTNEALSLYTEKEEEEHLDGSMDLLPSVEAILSAATTLKKWSTSIDKSYLQKYLFTNCIYEESENKYIPISAYEDLCSRYKLIRSLSPKTIYTGAEEVEEMLSICSKPKEEIIFSLENRKNIHSFSLLRTIHALEKKWLNTSSDAFLSSAFSEEIDKSCSTAFSSLLEVPETTENSSFLLSSKKHSKDSSLFQLASFFLLYKIEESSCFPGYSALLPLMEKKVNTFILENDPLISSQEKNKNFLLLAKISFIKAYSAYKECTAPPKLLLTEYILPSLSKDFGEHSMVFLGKIGELLLSIFNRASEERKEKKQDIAESKENRENIKVLKALKKEEEAINEINAFRDKEITKTEKLALSIGLDVFIRLCESEKKIEYLIGLIHFLFSERVSPSDLSVVSLASIPCSHFLPLSHQIVSKYFFLRKHEKSSFLLPLLEEALQRMIAKHPFPLGYSIFLREKETHESSLLSSSLRATLSSVVAGYKTLNAQGLSGAPLSYTFPEGVPVLTARDAPTIKKILSDSKKLKGVNTPVLIHVLGSNGKLYKEIIKKNDEVKQDILSMQVFSYMNRILSTSFCARIESRIRTYTIIALEKFLGVIEFISDAESLGTIVHELHKRKYPEEVSEKECRRIMDKVSNAPLPEKVEALRLIYKMYSPVLKWFFEGKGPFKYFEERKRFTQSFSLCAISTYILGLGDRHPQNILLDKRTKEMINIDVNLLFDQGRLLSISERIPFRLTRNIEQALLSKKTYTYQRDMEIFLSALKRKKEFLLVFLQILQNEPVHRWKQLQKEVSIPGLFSDYVSIMERMNNKLNGSENGSILSSKAQIHYLIQRATNVSNLAEIFSGWSPWI
ncbi:serine-protein kinase ATM [Nematocida sp. LUAm3]|nr:serine-protein kinase ATM [Nematocida sp. LUAm3]KAI5176283.1 serine-protein kinase ATM [Nematocida sp. LUAm2]KAI5179245.1 serine-protein kinase ATM [Nematocida sp. LUAm1]